MVPAEVRHLVVSIHDVSPLTLPAVDAILRDLSARRVRHTSLLVIPHHHEKRHMLQEPAFIERVKELSAAGHEPVIHGYTHRRSPRRKEGVATRAITGVYTAGEGEFYDINEERALAKVTQAQSDFRSIGLNPEGFIAPAWLLSKAGENALRSAHIRYTTRLGNIQDFNPARVIASQSLVYSVRSPWRRWTSLRWNRLLAHALRDNPVMRIGIHPVDWDHPRIRQQILDIVSQALLTRRPTTYIDLLEQFKGEGD